MMDSIIREGTLRLQTSEISCDVVLNCQGHRLMAHKLILSIASPVFRGLLREVMSEPAVIILPDINANVMSLLLDYIYTGSVVVYSNCIQEFLAVACLLKIHLDIDYGSKEMISKMEQESVTKKEMKDGIFSRRNQRKLPSLIPLNSSTAQKRSQKLCDFVVPSPWCPRTDRPVLGHPRDEYVAPIQDCQTPSPLRQENDSNNNFHFPKLQSTPQYIPSKLNQAIKNLYLNTTEKLLLHSPPEDLSRNFSSSKDSTSPRKLENFFGDLQKPLKKRVHEDVSRPSSNKSTEDAETKSSTSQEGVTTPLSPKSVSNDGNSTSNDTGESKTSFKYDKQKPFRCEDCGKCFSQLRNYKYHRSVHDGSREFAARCPECGKTFNDRGYLSSHLKIHRDRKEYACPNCPKRFNQRVAYNMHLRIHTGIKPHECPTCGKSFSRKMLLKQHQRVHTGERPYSCPECGKTFADRSNMSLHARLHTGVKPYACNLCPKSFTKKHHLKTHMNFHTGLKPYKCEKCGLAFSQSSNMRTHYKKCILKTNIPNNVESNGSVAANATSNSGAENT